MLSSKRKGYKRSDLWLSVMCIDIVLISVLSIII